MIPVILSGGSGTRLWPISRTKFPKQFCEIFGESLHTLTIKRLMKLGSPWIITSDTLKNLTLRECKSLEIPINQVIFEPMARNTAAAVGLLCHQLKLANYENEIVGVFPADQLIENEDSLFRALNFASKAAENNKVVTLGIQPTFPATGYGYIQISKSAFETHGDETCHSVTKFHEKPNLETATLFLNSNNFCWNAGIFIFKVKQMIEIFQRLQPKLWTSISQIKPDLSNLNSIYEHLENISIDFAIMEKLDESILSCIPCNIGWSDVGSWDAIDELITNKQTSTISVRSENNFLFSNLNKKYAFAEVNDLIVVDTQDALLITKKGFSQSVKDVYQLINNNWPSLTNEHVFEKRPWGQYEVLKESPDFKSKIIEVLPKEQLSYQCHSQREEHWIIIQGTGEVVLDDKIIPVQPGSYIKIPTGSKHRMRNTGDLKLSFIEVQMGSYFGEDDITRFQDDYQRK